MMRAAMWLIRLASIGFLCGVFTVAHRALTVHSLWLFWLYFVCLSIAFVVSLVLLGASFVPTLAKQAARQPIPKTKLDARTVAQILEARRKGVQWPPTQRQ